MGIEVPFDHLGLQGLLQFTVPITRSYPFIHTLCIQLFILFHHSGK